MSASSSGFVFIAHANKTDWDSREEGVKKE
jgi:hypothetical protein